MEAYNQCRTSSFFCYDQCHGVKLTHVVMKSCDRTCASVPAGPPPEAGRGPEGVLRPDQAQPDLRPLLRRQQQRDPQEASEHGGEDLRLSMMTGRLKPVACWFHCTGITVSPTEFLLKSFKSFLYHIFQTEDICLCSQRLSRG